MFITLGTPKTIWTVALLLLAANETDWIVSLQRPHSSNDASLELEGFTSLNHDSVQWGTSVKLLQDTKTARNLLRHLWSTVDARIKKTSSLAHPTHLIINVINLTGLRRLCVQSSLIPVIPLNQKSTRKRWHQVLGWHRWKVHFEFDTVIIELSQLAVWTLVGTFKSWPVVSEKYFLHILGDRANWSAIITHS